MQTDFKIHQIIENNDGSMVVTVNFFEGETTEQNESGKLVTRYRRTSKLQTKTFSFIPKKNKSDLDYYLKQELKKDLTRIPIPEQTI